MAQGMVRLSGHAVATRSRDVAGTGLEQVRTVFGRFVGAARRAPDMVRTTPARGRDAAGEAAR
ncbi:hypothetical protein ACLBXO_16635 [Methylobacterium sp. C33D]